MIIRCSTKYRIFIYVCIYIKYIYIYKIYYLSIKFTELKLRWNENEVQSLKSVE